MTQLSSGHNNTETQQKPSITETAAWNSLQAHYLSMHALNMTDAFKRNAYRFQQFSLKAAGLLLDYSKNRIDVETIRLLCQLGNSCELPKKIAAMFSGETVNTTEKRAALHMALRANESPVMIDGQPIMEVIHENRAIMRDFAMRIRSQQWLGFSGKAITDVVNIGIGGSELGPAMVIQALHPYVNKALNFHFVSNVDGHHVQDVLAQLNPATTLFIISSKYFTTQETLYNAAAAKAWLLNASDNNANAIAQHFIAVTAKKERALAFGISNKNIFPLWDWVGGRFSLWSAVGLPIVLAIGYEQFEQLLAGAHAMDEHFHHAPLAQNMPVILAFMSIWYRNFFGTHAHAILPYEHNLRFLPTYLQQLHMESLGKRVRHDGAAVDYQTGSIIWGGTGTNGQHTFHQLLHQGTALVPVDFIVSKTAHHDLTHHHEALYAHCLGQSKTLLLGKNEVDVIAELIANGVSETDAQQIAPHKVIPGNRPSNTIVLAKLNPFSLGALIALYEHKIFTQSVIWDINCFDQWGVELGKRLAHDIQDDLNQTTITNEHDNSTLGLIEYFKE